MNKEAIGILLEIVVFSSFIFLILAFGLWEAGAIEEETYIKFIQNGFLDIIDSVKYIFSRLF